MKKHLMLIAGLALAGTATPALADGMGFVRFEAGNNEIEASVDDLGSASDSDTTWGIRGGYWFNANFAVEGFYSQLYSTSLNDGFDTYRAKLHGVGIGLAAKHNFGGDHLGFFVGGRAGLVRGVTTLEYDGALEEVEANSTKPYFGVGIGYDFSERFGLSLNYDRLKGDDEGVDVTSETVTLGFELRF